jgi:hypothetical protein
VGELFPEPLACNKTCNSIPLIEQKLTLIERLVREYDDDDDDDDDRQGIHTVF